MIVLKNIRFISPIYFQLTTLTETAVNFHSKI